ncbi:MAG: amidohydrolase family protein [Nanoarchaeota archaeon]|nr:amidohydrolase family protein [Nanoarchaeota archaeon]
MIIDCHNHLGFENNFERQTSKELLRRMKIASIDKAVVFPFAPQTKTGSTYEDNKKIALLCKNNKKFIGFGRINQLNKNALEELDHILKLKLKGVKFHTRNSKITEAQEILDELEKHKLPIIVHTSDEKNTFVNFIEELKYSGPIIIAHAGKNRFMETVKIVNKYPNIYLDTSIISPFRTRYVIENANPEKIIFGSDSPYSHPKIDILKIKYATDDKKLRKMFFSDNIKKILKI